jgi:4'-phosphopantetheinyl transferase EntD
MPADSPWRPGRAGLIGTLLPPAVAVAESTGSPPANAPGLFPAEAAAVHTAGPRRRAEFAAGRSCGRAALAALGVAAGPILPGPAGQPLWPAGVTGSITHCAGYQACAVARTGDVAAIGIDAEPNAPLPAGLIERVATAPERAWISRHATASPAGAQPAAAGEAAAWPSARRAAAPSSAPPPPAAPQAVCWDRLLFSSKEAACKLWYPLTGQWLGFHDVSIGLAITAGRAASGTLPARVTSPACGTFTVSLTGPDPLTADRRVTRIAGRWLAGNGLIVAAIAWAPG